MEYWMASNETVDNGGEEEVQGVLDDPGSVVLFVGYPRWLLHFAASCCILFMLVGIPGNLFTIIALFRTKKLRNATAIFIINLSTSDLMFCCFNLPLATSTFWHSSWNHGLLLCRLFPLLRYGLVAVSLFTILAITINRYVMIAHPKLYRTLYKSRYLIPMVLSTWMVAFGVLIVTWFGNWGRFGLDTVIGSCSILPDVNGRSPKEFLFVVAFLIPCIAIVVCYARIFYIVRKTGFKNRKPGANSSTDMEIDHGQRSVSSRNQEDPSTLRSNCATGVLRANLFSKHLRASKRFDDSHEESELQQRKSKEERAKFRSKGTEKSKKQNRQAFEVQQEEETDFELKVDDVPYMDKRCDLEVPETEDFSIHNSRETKKSPNNRRRLERMASRASFIIESTFWPERMNSRVTSSTDRFDNSGSNSLDRFATRNAAITRKEARFRSVRRLKNQDGTPRMSNKDRKLLKMILVIFSSFLVCYLPITVTRIFKDAIDWRGLNIAGYILIYLTTCINPVVYVVMSSEYRSAYKNLLFCRNCS